MDSGASSAGSALWCPISCVWDTSNPQSRHSCHKLRYFLKVLVVIITKLFIQEMCSPYYHLYTSSSCTSPLSSLVHKDVLKDYLYQRLNASEIYDVDLCMYGIGLVTVYPAQDTKLLSQSSCNNIIVDTPGRCVSVPPACWRKNILRHSSQWSKTDIWSVNMSRQESHIIK